MRNFLVFLVLTGSIPCVAQIDFVQSSWEEALKKARTEGKIIFLEGFADWSEPCQLLEKYAFADLEVSNYYNSSFVNFRMDMEQYPGISLAEDYKVSVYPALLYIDGDGNVIHRGCGAMDAAGLLELGRKAAGSATLQAFQKQFESGQRETDFLLEYLAMMEDGCLDAEGFAQRLLSGTDFKLLADENYFSMIEEYQWDMFSREFGYLLDSMRFFEISLGTDRVHDKIFNTFLAQYQEIFLAEELHLFALRAYIDRLKPISFVGSDTLLTMANVHHSEITEDWEAFSENAIEWVQMSGGTDPEEVNELAWKFYLFVEDKEKLKIAANWVRKVVDSSPSPTSIDTYASLLYKLGDRKKAIELEKQAILMAIKLFEDSDHYEHQLQTFQRR